MHVERTREKKEASGTARESGSLRKSLNEREGVRVLVGDSDRGFGRFWRCVWEYEVLRVWGHCGHLIGLSARR
jgi:hypothetical protein